MYLKKEKQEKEKVKKEINLK